MVGIQGKRRVTRKKVESGIGTGGTLRLAYPSYTYNAAPGFTEHDLDEYDRVCAELAWSRSLATATRAFARDAGLELALEANVQGEFPGLLYPHDLNGHLEFFPHLPAETTDGNPSMTDFPLPYRQVFHSQPQANSLNLHDAQETPCHAHPDPDRGNRGC